MIGRVQTFLIILAFALTPVLRGPAPEADFDYDGRQFEPILDVVLNETSSGLASGAATPDGRPLLWKSRDRGGRWANEILYYDDGRIPFIGMTNENVPAECYGGINAEGFAIENTDAHNLAEHGAANDGRTMLDALARCRTVDDFAALLDSADLVDEQGRYGYNYGVIDAYGGAAIYEAYQFGHRRYDAADSPDGVLIRSNFSYQGAPPENNPSFYGRHRHNRALELFKDGHDNGNLTAEYILRTVARDLTIDDFDPYPLPFRGYFDREPYGVVNNLNAICRYTTTAVMVAQGVRAGERPDDAILWTMNGSPVCGIMTPLWVRAGSVPVEYDTQQGSRINRRIIALFDLINHTGDGKVDTWLLTNPSGTGLWDFLLPLEHYVFQKTERFLRSPQFHYDRLQSFQNELAQQMADSLDRWEPTYCITEVTGQVFWDRHIDLAWGEIDGGEIGREVPIDGYIIYRAAEPFREGVTGEQIGFVRETQFRDDDPLPQGGFYQVVAVFQ